MIRQPRHDAAVVLPAAGRHLIAASVHLSARSLLALLEECNPDRSNGRAADNAVGESRGHLAQQAVEELVQRRLGHVERLAASTLLCHMYDSAFAERTQNFLKQLPLLQTVKL